VTDEAALGEQVTDEGLADWLRVARASPALPCEDVGAAALREGQRARAAGRPPGPSLHRVTDLLACGRIAVRLYRPAADDLPLVLYVHGGGFVMGSLDSHDSTCRRLARTASATVLAVEQRLAPEHRGPAAVDDVVDVYSWARERLPDLGALKGRAAALAGDSSGAATAVLAAVRLIQSGDRPSALLLAYPNADLTLGHPSVREKGTGWGLDARDLAWFVEQWAPDPARRRDPSLSPLDATLAGLPPALVATAEHDPLRDEGAALAARMAAAGVPVRHLEHPGLVHGFLGLGHVSPGAEAAAERLFSEFGRLLPR
jgi:acetyl esterase